MPCDVCKSPHVSKTITIGGNSYGLCEYDVIFVDRILNSRVHNNMVNIAWGDGRISHSCWGSIRETLRAHKVTEVLEIGCGLSSELFVNEGLKLVGFDVLPDHVNLLNNLAAMQGHAVFHQYDYGTIPPIKELYPGKTWDFIFVDGPQERSREVKLAMELGTNIMILHDPNMGEQSFFPNDQWKEISFKTYQRVQPPVVENLTAIEILKKYGDVSHKGF